MVPFTPEMLGVLAIWALAVVSPGPAFLVLSQAAAGRSRAAALGVSLGIAIVAVTYAALTMYGLAVVVAQVGWLAAALRIAGALYLIYLGLTLFRNSGAPQEEDVQEQGAAHFVAGIRTGLITAAGNPKAIAFFLSLFAAVLPHDLTSGAKVELLVAGFFIEMSWYMLVASVLSTRWVRRQYARARATIDRVLGSALVLAGVRMSGQ
jgi:threonine/homoserine/homoserine lactone efflux protein